MEEMGDCLRSDMLPNVRGLEMEARYLPSSGETSRDWYDAFQLPDQRLMITMGEVIGTAADTQQARNTLRTAALTHQRPASVLEMLNRLFKHNGPLKQKGTVTYLVIDPESGEGQAGNAGHTPTLLLTPGALPVLDGSGTSTPLGWLNSLTTPRHHDFRLQPGSTAVLYSDGLLENRVRGFDAGLDELVRIAAAAQQDLIDAPGRLLQYLLDNMLQGYEQDDDVTILVVHAPSSAVTGGRKSFPQENA